MSLSSMIRNQIGTKNLSEVEVLQLDECPNPDLKDLTPDLVNVTEISLTSCNLESLENFPKLPKLEKLYLNDNKLTGSLEHLTGCPNLMLLNISGNPIAELEMLEPLVKLEKLMALDYLLCPFAALENGTGSVRKLLPQVEFINNRNENGEEMDSSDDELDSGEEEFNLQDLRDKDLEDDEDDEEFKPTEDPNESESDSGDDDDDDDDDGAEKVDKDCEPASKKIKVDEDQDEVDKVKSNGDS